MLGVEILLDRDQRLLLPVQLLQILAQRTHSVRHAAKQWRPAAFRAAEVTRSIAEAATTTTKAASAAKAATVIIEAAATTVSATTVIEATAATATSASSKSATIVSKAATATTKASTAESTAIVFKTSAATSKARASSSTTTVALASSIIVAPSTGIKMSTTITSFCIRVLATRSIGVVNRAASILWPWSPAGIRGDAPPLMHP
mmetsp:Transcript_13690/g.25948  ORF Transcript_13690/g.25948 Transcript_13690/m.25948 type:complete len:204 (-) Transcript_13690:163-774(-)